MRHIRVLQSRLRDENSDPKRRSANVETFRNFTKLNVDPWMASPIGRILPSVSTQFSAIHS